MKAKTKALALPDLPSFSPSQLAQRWGCKRSDVEDCVRTGTLRAHVLLHNTMADIPSGKNTRRVKLDDGHYLLPVASAVALLDHNQGPPVGLCLGVAFDVLVKEPGTIGRVEVEYLELQAKHFDVRVLRQEVGRYEAATSPDEKPAAPLRESQRHRERCRAIAQVLWKREPALTIEDMIDRSEITRIGQESAAYDRTTLRNWIKDLCPNRAPGRRPKNSRGDLG